MSEPETSPPFSRLIDSVVQASTTGSGKLTAERIKRHADLGKFDERLYHSWLRDEVFTQNEHWLSTLDIIKGMDNVQLDDEEQYTWQIDSAVISEVCAFMQETHYELATEFRNQLSSKQEVNMSLFEEFAKQTTLPKGLVDSLRKQLLSIRTFKRV